VDFFFNERSFHGQFHTVADFHGAVEKVMEIRREISKFGSVLHCHPDLANAEVTQEARMRQAIHGLPLEKQRAWIQWLTRHGPFWIDERRHSSDEWLELEDEEIVTETSVGEAAFCRIHGLEREVVSVDPSRWLRNPIRVRWRKSDEATQEIEVVNHWSLDTISDRLKALPPAFDSWESLEEHLRRTCDRLIIDAAAFESLDGHPYVSGAAERIQIRLNILNQMRGCFDEQGNHSEEGNRLFTDHFTGEKAWFSDSSATEKAEFESELTFPHPARPGQYLFCTWHGKVKTPQIRIHFSWPISAKEPLYIVYVGPKITKR